MAFSTIYQTGPPRTLKQATLPYSRKPAPPQPAVQPQFLIPGPSSRSAQSTTHSSFSTPRQPATLNLQPNRPAYANPAATGRSTLQSASSGTGNHFNSMARTYGNRAGEEYQYETKYGRYGDTQIEDPRGEWGARVSEIVKKEGGGREAPAQVKKEKEPAFKVKQERLWDGERYVQRVREPAMEHGRRVVDGRANAGPQREGGGIVYQRPSNISAEPPQLPILRQGQDDRRMRRQNAEDKTLGQQFRQQVRQSEGGHGRHLAIEATDGDEEEHKSGDNAHCRHTQRDPVSKHIPLQQTTKAIKKNVTHAAQSQDQERNTHIDHRLKESLAPMEEVDYDAYFGDFVLPPASRQQKHNAPRPDHLQATVPHFQYQDSKPQTHVLAREVAVPKGEPDYDAQFDDFMPSDIDAILEKVDPHNGRVKHNPAGKASASRAKIPAREEEVDELNSDSDDSLVKLYPQARRHAQRPTKKEEEEEDAEQARRLARLRREVRSDFEDEDRDQRDELSESEHFEEGTRKMLARMKAQEDYEKTSRGKSDKARREECAKIREIKNDPRNKNLGDQRFRFTAADPIQKKGPIISSAPPKPIVEAKPKSKWVGRPWSKHGWVVINPEAQEEPVRERVIMRKRVLDWVSSGEEAELEEYQARFIERRAQRKAAAKARKMRAKTAELGSGGNGQHTLVARKTTGLPHRADAGTSLSPPFTIDGNDDDEFEGWGKDFSGRY